MTASQLCVSNLSFSNCLGPTGLPRSNGTASVQDCLGPMGLHQSLWTASVSASLTDFDHDRLSLGRQLAKWTGHVEPPFAKYILYYVVNIVIT